MENNEQIYVEVGSNIYLGTKDGIKYSLMQAPDSKFRLVEAPSDSSISLSDSSGYVNKYFGYFIYNRQFQLYNWSILNY